MKHVFELTRFETRADRPLFIGDVGSYVLRIVLSEETENGLLTAAAFRPNTENPVISSVSFSGKAAEVTLVSEQYDKEGETKILCTVSDGSGTVLTARVLYVTVLSGIGGGTVGKDDYTDLTRLISLAGKATSDCADAVSEAESAVSSCLAAADRAERAASALSNVPTKVSQLENDKKYIENSGTDLDEYRKIIQIGSDDLYELVLKAYEITIVGNTSGSFTVSNLSAPQNDSDAATKGYVDEKIASAVTTALNTAV